MVQQIRIDERLAHGQVCIGWIKFLGCTHVIIANDVVANDEFQKQMMMLGIPKEVKTIFSTMEKTISILNDPRSNPLKIFVIVKSPKDALTLVDNVADITEVNLGNYGVVTPLDNETKKQYHVWIWLDAESTAILKELKTKVKEVYNHRGPSFQKEQINL